MIAASERRQKTRATRITVVIVCKQFQEQYPSANNGSLQQAIYPIDEATGYGSLAALNTGKNEDSWREKRILNF